MKKINYISVLFILAFGALTMNVAAQSSAFVRVDANPADNNWAGKYLVVYEAQAGPGSGTTYKSTTVLVFNSALNGPEAPLDAAGNIIALSPTPGDLVALTGGTIDNSVPGEITVTGGQIAWSEDLDAAAITIAPAPADGKWLVKTGSGYYIGATGNNGILSANVTPNTGNHVNTISIGDTDSNAATGITFKKCAIILSQAGNALRVNGNTGRFGYWGIVTASGLYGQHPVALYKLTDLGTGINLPKTQSDIKVYLTAGGDAIVESVAAIQSLTVVSITGAVLTREQFPNSGETSCRINMQSFPAGVYIVNVETLEGTTAKKLIINN